MSGQLIGGVVGAVVGFFIGGPAGAKAGWVIGSMIGGIIDPNLPEIADQMGPRLSDLNVISSAYGVAIPIVYGSYRVAGNVIWSEEIKETKHVKEVEYGKGGSETYEIVTYSYSITMALGLSAGTIGGFNTIWADSVKIYDAHNGGYTQIVIESEEKSGDIVFYNGDSQQDIDWILQAAEADTPAYRNLCYIVFNDFQLENFGNRIPNFSIELISDGEIELTNSVVYNIPSTADDTLIIPTTKQSSSKIKSYVLAASTNEVKVYSMADRLEPWYDYSYLTDYTYNDIIGSNIISDDSELYVEIIGSEYIEIHHTNTGLVAVGPKDSYLGTSDYIVKAGDTFYAYYTNTTNIVLEFFNTTNTNYYNYYNYTGNNLGRCIEIYNTTIYRDMYTISPGIFYTFSTIDKSIVKINSTGIIYYDYTDLNVTFNNSPTIPLTHSYIRVDTSDNMYVFQWETDGKPSIYKISEFGNDFINKTLYVASLHPEKQMFNVYNEKYYIYNDDIVDNTYSALNLFSDIFIKEGVTLEYILDDILKKTKLNTIDYDVTAGASDVVSGYCISRQMSSRSAIEGLRSIYQFFIIENDYLLSLIKIINNVVETIDESELLDDLEIIRRLNTELPKKITLRYPNELLDYQPGSQSVIRMDGSTEYSKVLETTLVLTDTESKQLVEELMYTTWSERVTYSFNIPLNTNIKVSDTINIVQDNIVYTLRLVEIMYSDTMECKGISSNTYKIESNATGSDTSAGFIPYLPQLQGPSELLLFNAPTLDNSLLGISGIYYGASGHVDSWRGCNILKSTDGGLLYNNISNIISNSILGYTTTTLLNGPTTLWDLNNDVKVRIYSGSLYSSTSYNLLKSKENYIMIGNEVLQYTTATYNIDGTYTLSNLLRGRLGTEWAVSNHTYNELFIFLDNNIQFDSNSINILNKYKAITFGYSIDSTDPIDGICDGTNLTPLAPSYLYKKDNIITWHRRDRYINGNFYTKPFSDITSNNITKYKLEFFYNSISKGIVYIDKTRTDTTSYTYDGSFDPVDKIQISQYSIKLDAYGYITEEIL